jgi:hypothetical protein
MSTPIRHFLIASLGWLPYVIALTVLTAACLLSGCRMVPRQDGGAIGTTITPGGISTGTRLADSPEDGSRQSVKRTVVETFSPTPHVWPRTALAAPQEPLQTAPAVLTQRTTTDEVKTEVGASQDLAGIVKAAQSKWQTIVAILFAGILCVGSWQAYKREWPTPAGILAVGALVTLITLTVWWGVGAIAASVGVTLVWRAAKPIP